ncbi:MAG: ATP-binding protein [Opitutae bacterium]|jgi:predicted AAA+ superfamily ATPase|nr:ATP-binding protein [Kiritimatiellia bacterium]NCA83728.1 ATP-binding protein [Opitutae bacterium]
MKYKQRQLAARIDQLLEHFPVLVVSGARQVGKSTLLAHHLPKWESIVFDPVVDVGNARSDPELFLRNHPPPVVLDEIQYCPELVPSIKRRVDMDGRPGMFVLTGSQQWSVLKSVGESLAGRAVFLDLDGFSLAEMAEDIPSRAWLERYLDAPDAFAAETPRRHSATRPLYECLWRGTLPAMDALPKSVAPDFFAGYLRTYVERDVRLMLEAGDWQQFGRFVQLAAALTAQEVNFSQLGREIGITPQTSKRWLAVLQATFQWFELPAYQGNAIKRISAKPKGYLADTGLACHLSRITSPDALGGHPMAGALFETFVVSEIRKLCAAMERKPAIYHWRSHSGGEVDLILERDGVLHPIEIKLASRPTRNDARGFASFRANHPRHRIAPGLVLAPAERLEHLTDHDLVAPYDMV